MNKKIQLPQVRMYTSIESTPMKISYGGDTVEIMQPPLSFDIDCGDMKIQSLVQNIYCQNSEHNLCYARFLTVSMNDKPAPKLKPVAKTIIAAMVAIKKIKMPLKQALFDATVMFR